ncbi:MAG: cytochrome c oxidase subunit II [Fibrobacteria bacterium]|nr:cytochrome c oxidase subunit II [Fibrobacteria bacterium]
MNANNSFWLAEKASSLATYVDGTFYGYLGFSLVLVVIISLLTIFFVIKGRNQAQTISESSPCKQAMIQTGWTALILIVLAGFFCYGLRGFIKLQVPPNTALVLGVTATSAAWQFHYLDGTSPDSLIVPVNLPVKLEMSSADNVHGISIPSMRVGKGVVPNRKTVTWFNPNKEGLFAIYNTSGAADAVLKVLSEEDYAHWIKVKFDPSIGKTPEEYGLYVYEKQGCNACHSVDGSKIVGPTLKGFFGTERALDSAEAVIADSAYVVRSLLEPNVEVAAGFKPTMLAYPLKAKEMNALIAYLKSLQ